MKNQFIKEKSAISRTNQLQILPNKNIVEKLYQYLFKADKGIEHFELQYPPTTDKDSEEEDTQQDNSESKFFEERHKFIKKEVQKRLAKYGKEIKYGDIQYFLSYSNGKNYVFFLSPNKNHSGWQQLFDNNQERIFNLVFKFYLLSQVFYGETIDSFEELFFLHSKSLTKSKNALVTWGQNLLVKYNHHDVLTLTLTRKIRRFLPKDKKDYKTLDGDDLGELIVYKNKNYYFDRDLDARHSNSISFMDFGKDKNEEKYSKFQKTQLYYYQNLMTKLEAFLTECDIKFKILDFQADHYLENPFIKNIEAVESLEIINNTGIDLTQSDREFFQNFLKHQGIPILTFYNSGKTISNYENKEIEGEDASCWEITEIIPWSSIELDKQKNYLIFNKLLEAEVGSMAYQNDGFWYPSTKLDGKSQVDFYSQLKQKYNYLDTGEFYSIQGINVPQFEIIQKAKKGRKKEEENNLSVLNYGSNIDLDILQQDCKTFSNERVLDEQQSLTYYLTQQDNLEKWEKFCNKYKLKIAPEFEKVLIELGIKNWIRQSLLDSSISLPINHQSFSEQQFWVIYVRSPKKQEAKAVAVKFLYKDDCIYIKDIMHDLKQIKRKFNFLRKRKNSEKLINDQQYFVDESAQIYVSCYTDNRYTPTLIGRHGIIEELEKGILQVNKTIKGEDASKLLPLVSYYNSQTNPINKIKNRICLDLHNKTFIQYYVPPASNINEKIKKGFRVYHLIGKKYSEELISTSELIDRPIVSLHFSTLTQNILKISENSQSSLLQKIARILIEN